jgi:hypothetical protein
MLSVLLFSLGLSVTPNADAIQVLAMGKQVAPEATYHQPMNKSSASVALFSEQRDLFSIVNSSGGEIAIDSITIHQPEGQSYEEYSLQDTANKPAPLDVQNVVLAPKERFDFYVRFYPVHSGVRKAVVTIQYAGDQSYSFQVSGKGRDNAKFFSKAGTSLQQIYGGPNTDEQATGMAADDQGNVYLVGQVTQVVDKFAYDLLVSKVTPSGELVWSKMWAGPFRDYTRDPGQNDQTGGGADAVTVDAAGNLYIAGAISRGRSNNDFAAFVMKVTPQGELAWEKLWRPEWPSSLLAKHGAQAYGLTTYDGRVYVTGSTGAARSGAESHIFALALEQTDGSLVWQKAIDPNPGVNDRGYTIAVHGDQLYIGGSANNRGYLLRMNGLADPQIAWFKKISAGTGSNINSLALDTAGNVFAAVDVRGLNCTFSLLKMDPSGQQLWAKTYVGGRANQNNNTHIVRTVGDDVLVGGRIAMAWMDGQMGDGFVMRCSGEGELKWSSFYYTGKGPDEIQETRIKGLAMSGQTLLCFGQLYTGNMNGVRYHGYWYDGTGKLGKFQPSISTQELKEPQCFAIEKGEVHDAAKLSKERQWIDTPETLIWQDARAKSDGKGPDEDWFFMRLDFGESGIAQPAPQGGR